MSLLARPAVNARKTPVQVRSAETVEAIFEATIQVLLGSGLTRLTTTRVAVRAGVSVGTLYQYFPNKHALLFALLERHLKLVSEAVEQACVRHHGYSLEIMIEGLVKAYVDAKLHRAEVSGALYKISAALDGTALSGSVQQRSRTAIASMLLTASDQCVRDSEVKAAMLSAAMAGATRLFLEASTYPGTEESLHRELVLLGRGYLQISTE